MTTKASELSLAQLLCGFAYASDIAFGLQLEDSVRSCYVAFRLAEKMGLSAEACRATYFTALLKDAGCTSFTTELAAAWQTDEIAARRDLIIFSDPGDKKMFFSWMTRYVAQDRRLLTKLSQYFGVLTRSRGLFAEAYSTTATIACRIAARLGMPDSVQTALLALFEQWNGQGLPKGLSGTEIPIVSRIVLPTFFIVPFHRVAGREAALQVAGAFSGRAFDPAVVNAFHELATDESFWAELESHVIRDIVINLEPGQARVREDAVDDAALAFADFIDLKSRYKAAHSRRVGAVAEQIARLMNCAEESVAQIRRGGLMHDLGVVGVPSYVLDRPWQELSESERDQYRLYPYHGERILKRVPTLMPLAEMVGTHQERVDGSGYYRGLTGTNISLGARIIAVADRLDELTHDHPGAPALPTREALDALGREPLDQDVISALRRALGEKARSVLSAPRPAALTEREVEVLSLMTRGLTRREIGRHLSISENTVRNHLDHIYDKTGTSNRVSATMFAMENGILGT